MTDQNDLAISVPEAARRLGIGKSKTWELIAQGRIPAVRIGGRTVVPAAELAEFFTGLPRVEPKLKTTRDASVAS